MCIYIYTSICIYIYLHLHTVDGQIIQTLHPWVVDSPYPGGLIQCVHSKERSKQENNIEIWGERGCSMCKGFKHLSIYGMYIHILLFIYTYAYYTFWRNMFQTTNQWSFRHPTWPWSFRLSPRPEDSDPKPLGPGAAIHFLPGNGR